FLALDLLHGDLKRRLSARQLGVAVVSRELQLHVARLSGPRSEQALLEPRDQLAPAQLDQLVATLAARERDHRRLARSLIQGGQTPDVVDDHEVALAGRALRRLQARET